ncbi:MAG: hypothetical protein R2698_00475 [Microthrixaceae bacterium]
MGSATRRRFPESEVVVPAAGPAHSADIAGLRRRVARAEDRLAHHRYSVERIDSLEAEDVRLADRVRELAARALELEGTVEQLGS